MQSWDEHRENHDALLREMNRDRAFTPWLEMCRWRRRFWWLLVLGSLLVGYLFALLVSKP